jgi:lysophospholipase L1-like esterase
MFAAAIPMGGAADVSKAELIKDIPIWTFHQMLDTVVLSQGTQNMVSKLVECGGNIKFTPYFDLQHNAWTRGYVEKDLLQWLYSHKKSRIKVACVGDSITAGAGVNNPKTEAYPAVLQSLLGHNFIVENFGKSACSALKTAKYPYTDTEEYQKSLEFKPDIVFIMLGTNDIKTENWADGSERFENDYIDIINSYKKINSDVKIYTGIPPRIFKENVYGERSPQILENEGIPRIFNVVEQTGAKVINIFEETKERGDLFPDFLHPNAEGNNVIADIIYENLSGIKTKTKSVLNGASDWAKHELGLAYAIALMPECTIGNYQDNITREDFCEAVVSMIPEDIAGTRTAVFEDTDNPAVSRAYSLGIVNGVTETEFAPDEYITREAICTILERAFKVISPEATTAVEKSYPDEELISDWAKQSIDFMSNAKIILGDENGNINPKSYTTREQALLLVYRTYYNANAFHHMSLPHQIQCTPECFLRGGGMAQLPISVLFHHFHAI